MIINEIELYNFRIYKGLNKIALNSDKNHNIFIISGKNGFGKTTFLMSLVWCLYGRNMHEVDDLYKKEISDQGGYNTYIASSLNRSARLEEDYNFHVSITFSEINIPEVPCQNIVIKRSYNAKTSISDDVEVLIDGYPSELAKEVGPELFIREFIMPIEIAKFFFFDAEKIVNLAEVSTAEQRKDLSKAYSEVLGIKKYEDMKTELENLQLKIKQESASVTEKNLLEQLKADLAKKENLILEVREKIRASEEEKNEKAKESRDIQEKLIREGSSITIEELQRLRKIEEDLTQKLEALQNELKESFDVIPFAVAGEKFLEVKNQLDNELNYKVAQFKEENVKGVTNKILTELMSIPKPPHLAIDHQVHKFYEDTFEKLIRKHFFADTPSLPDDFMVLHEFSDTERNELLAVMNNLKFSFREAFKRINGDSIQSRNELNAVKRKIRDAEANREDPIISEYRKQKDTLDRAIIHLEDTIKSLIREDEGFVIEKKQIGNRIEELSRKLQVSEKNKEKDEVISRNIANLKVIIQRVKEQKKLSLQEQILKGLETLMHKKGFINKVEVDIIGEDIDIKLRNARGEVIKKESLSKGEQQMYATALLRGLVEESDIEFPVFIDSPMQKFDEQHAENIIRYFYPNISDQVILFPLINKELTEKEYDILSRNIAHAYLINNIHEDKSEFLALEPTELFNVYNRMYNNVN